MAVLGLDFSRLNADPALNVRPLDSLDTTTVIKFLRQRHRYDEAMAEQQARNEQLFQFIPVRSMIAREVLEHLMDVFGRHPNDPIADREIIRYLKELSVARYGERIWEERENDSFERTQTNNMVMELYSPEDSWHNITNTHYPGGELGEPMEGNSSVEYDEMEDEESSLMDYEEQASREYELPMEGEGCWRTQEGGYQSEPLYEGERLCQTPYGSVQQPSRM